MLFQIRKMQFSHRIKLFVIVAAIVIYLNSSFMISFYQSEVIFTDDSDSLSQINHFLRREECAYNLLIFLRENLIRNQTTEMTYYYTDTYSVVEPALQFYISLCSDNEVSISNFKQNVPVYLNDAKQVISD